MMEDNLKDYFIAIGLLVLAIFFLTSVGVSLGSLFQMVLSFMK